MAKQVERTRGIIFEALMNLLDEKSYEEITITNITDRAKVARASFYRNYEDKEDIIYKKLQDDMINVLNIIKEYPYKDIVTAIFMHIHEHGMLSQRLIEHHLDAILARCIFKIERLILSNNHFDDYQEEIAATYHLSGLFRVLIFSLHNYHQKELKEIYQEVDKLIGEQEKVLLKKILMNGIQVSD